MSLKGKRHPFLAQFEAGFDREGRLEGVRVRLYADGGWSLDLSEAVLGRAMFHIDNAYYIPALEVTGFICKTHKTSQTAFRGFGGPQGMLVIEDILDRVARTLGLPQDSIRERNFYREGDTTHYGQPVKDAVRIGRIWAELKESSDFAARIFCKVPRAGCGTAARYSSMSLGARLPLAVERLPGFAFFMRPCYQGGSIK